MVGESNKEKDIMCDQHLELIYSQLGILYDIIPNDPQSSTDPRNPKPRPYVDGVVSLFTHTFVHHLAD
jgi:hypothetical protein